MKCEWCGKPIERTSKFGPDPKYCRDTSCRQRAHEERTTVHVGDPVFISDAGDVHISKPKGKSQQRKLKP